jgi:hypothetical protein
MSEVNDLGPVLQSRASEYEIARFKIEVYDILRVTA